MSASKKRKRKRVYLSKTRPLDDIDYSCILEGTAIDRKFAIGVVRTPRLKFTYRVDGQVFHTGAKHRYGGGLHHKHTDGLRPVAKPIQKRNSKQKNLQSEGVHKRVENPQLYKTLDTRRIIHLMEYKAGIVRANNQF